MVDSTIGVKVSEELRQRLKAAAAEIARTPHWLAKKSLIGAIEAIERGDHGIVQEGPAVAEEVEPVAAADQDGPPAPFIQFAQTVQPQGALRARITSAYRLPERECLPYLLAEATLSPEQQRQATETATRLVSALRAKGQGGGVEGLIQEYSLSSQEGVALMCLAEALLRIPDRATRDALIRDKISTGDWQSHVGRSPSLFVNAATWGLVVTGKLTSTASEKSLSSALTKLIGRGGEPVIRKGVDMAMRMMGEQFVTGQDIGEALANARKMEARGFRYSYDMLGEAATTAADADRYYADYERAIHAIGKASGGRGIYEGPGISVKLSALHARYSRAQADRVMAELYPRLKALVILARGYDIAVNIDAEEADRLELSLDLLEGLCAAPELKGWNGIGFVIQAYSKRCPYVIDHVIDLARRTGHRLMIRLVKGAYWDSEIKRAQVDGLEDFPVFTRKVHTDVSYLACARKLLAAPDAVFPQFATHNARTLASVMAMAGGNYYAGQYEFQCLHGMGEPLYEEVVGADKLNRPCRIYAPVGTHETLLAYLVRRLLENGANSSFVNQIGNADVPIASLVVDPVEVARKIEPLGSQHPAIRSPRDLYGPSRPNSAGLDLVNEQRLASLSAALLTSAATAWRAEPADEGGIERPVYNPADGRDIVGTVWDCTPVMVDAALARAVREQVVWGATPAAERAACLRHAADLMEARMPILLGLIVREAGKSLPNAIAEVREAVDFLRYYADAAQDFAADTHRPLGPVACISPWNFPLAIFTGQVSAALAAGNTVLAKPAEETPLIAAEAVRLLHAAGVPADALQLVTGAGDVGGMLTGDARVRGVVFTGSTEVARLIQKTLAKRVTPEGHAVPLVAETGGMNAMIVDSSALAEQVVGDVIASAFDSAGQRCSALRILCVQEDVADRTLEMLWGAMNELSVNNPDRLSTDVGPVITAEARDRIQAHVDAMAARGHKVRSLPLPAETRNGTFVAPTMIEIDAVADVEQEVFGPVLHVLRYAREDRDAVLEQVNASGYGLTFGVHSRIDETIARLTDRSHAGNIYVNRNIIGAVVGVQPFGGQGLSGTGPKAGGPLYVPRLLASRPAVERPGLSADPAMLAPYEAYADWLRDAGHGEALAVCQAHSRGVPLGALAELPGPVGERNLYRLEPRGTIALIPSSTLGLLVQLGAALATGNDVVVESGQPVLAILEGLPSDLARRVHRTGDWAARADLGGVLFEGDADALIKVNAILAERPGRIVTVQGATPADLASGRSTYNLDLLLEEKSVSTNTAAAGGNATLMAIG
ncbi:trifunctional transcriptional regulator/proline dehydrogenase/L-glutamate gamma-semialdehyde dehydrogenase [Edaphosphingomonas haloaromaticamans]|uniref:Bifunctional protein PutA n=1 Tax=Edaphosphingomonas haloaromaticamans TaxID=653954 RepID=A0A1S1HEX0_9SPHN|nr:MULTISPECIES: trifunctional transcriptional regulator/proline dehydrogenase/L-glutamate gamma-semialdehyde dehydrogenase [Sphingomonas]MDX3884698.1 trifunctional transcriptional regulator/proline dehydrogenase/L-glutamate gamma-semialdehyde dehydrogenase [Sphingomonas sp.]OHT19773.1 Bifunctional protein PutA [Sphingomonas haloaromaticamans]